MNLRPVAMLLASVLVLVGCATKTEPVALSPDALGANSGKVGVAMTALPKVDTHLPGADCLLCAAAAAMANTSLTTRAHQLPYEDLPKLKDQVADALRKKGANVTVIEEDLAVDSLPGNASKGANAARKDCSSLQSRFNVDKLLVMQINGLGFLRTYNAYFPTSDPKGYVRSVGYAVDLKTNTYDWYQPIDVTKAADGPWEESPEFPGLTNAYFQALGASKESVLETFKK